MNDLKRNFAYTPRTQNPPQALDYNVLGLAADGFEFSMYFYVKVHFQKNFISENKVHCVLNRARTLTISLLTVSIIVYLNNYVVMLSHLNYLILILLWLSHLLPPCPALFLSYVTDLYVTSHMSIPA